MTGGILQVENLLKRFEGLTAIDGTSVSFQKDELCAIIGPNGAGKSTFFNLVMGQITPTSGRILFKGEEIAGLSPNETVKWGIVKSFQTSNVFGNLTVFENVRLASQASHNPYNFWRRKDDFDEIISKTEDVLKEMNMYEKMDVVASDLSHGEERTLEIAVALATDPDLLLLDEPSSGMSPQETQEVIDLINRISQETSIIFIEHKMSVAMGVADRVIVLHNGRVLADGPPQAIRDHEEVKNVYLGTD